MMKVIKHQDAIKKIEEALPSMHARDMVPSDEILDLLLDIRGDLVGRDEAPDLGADLVLVGGDES